MHVSPAVFTTGICAAEEPLHVRLEKELQLFREACHNSLLVDPSWEASAASADAAS